MRGLESLSRRIARGSVGSMGQAPMGISAVRKTPPTSNERPGSPT